MRASPRRTAPLAAERSLCPSVVRRWVSEELRRDGWAAARPQRPMMQEDSLKPPPALSLAARWKRHNPWVRTYPTASDAP
jgi:hypothetical protein